jgi:hypothetical protein
VTGYFFTLGLTLVVEVLVALLVLPRASWSTRLVDVMIANLVSHPLATLAVRSLGTPWTLAEIAVAVGEAAIYRYLSGFPWRRAILLSLVCNVVTAAMSFMV